MVTDGCYTVTHTHFMFPCLHVIYNSDFEIYSAYRGIHLSMFNFASKEFEEAKTRLGTLKEDPGNDVKLKMYALFKQVISYSVNAKSKSKLKPIHASTN